MLKLKSEISLAHSKLNQIFLVLIKGSFLRVALHLEAATEKYSVKKRS